MSSKALVALKEALSEDPAYAKLKEVVSRLRQAPHLNVERILTEAKTLHESRTSRNLYKVSLKPIALHEADHVDGRSRARLSTMRADLMREVDLLTASIEKVKVKIRSEYSKYLDAWSNQPARNATVDLILAPATEYLENLVSCREILDVYIKDIDQMAYRIRNSVDLLKLTIERKDQMV